jgi:proline dehydrogenase
MKELALGMSLVHDLSLKVAKHWIAGEAMRDAIVVAQEVNMGGMCALVNYLGEDTTDAKVIAENVEEYARLVSELKSHGLCSSISLKATQFGLEKGVGEAVAAIRDVLDAASRIGMFVWFDMEQYLFKNRILDIFHKLHETYPSIGVCIQSYLRDTWDDLQKLVDTRSIVRIVKGAYRESPSVCYTSRKDIYWNFLRCVQFLGERTDLSFAVGTHDDYLIDQIRKMQFGLSPPEFQLLHGVRTHLQHRLVDSGYSVSVYIPYGTDWSRYAWRRVRERPETIWLLGKSLVSNR